MDATAEVGQPANHATECCSPDLGDASVWYKWTAPSSGLFAFDTFGSDLGGHDTVLGVYTGSLGSLAEVNSTQGFSDDYGGPCCDSRVVFSAAMSTTYYIAVSGCCGSPGATQGAFTLNWSAVTRPGNDDFASATVISGSSGSLSSQTNFDATPQAGELSGHQNGFDLGGDSVWYSWVAPATGGFTFSTSGTDYRGGDFDDALAAYTGSLGSLTEVAYTTSGVLALAATGSTTYTIGVGGCCGYSNGVYWGDMGSFTLIWDPDTTPPDTTITSTSRGQHSVSFTFTGSDNITTPANLDFECKIGTGTFASCTSPKTYSAITGGLHTVQVRAIDEAANVDPSPASATIRAKGSPKTTG